MLTIAETSPKNDQLYKTECALFERPLQGVCAPLLPTKNA